MKRRNFLAAGLALAAVPSAALAKVLNYAPGLARKRLDAGETVFLDFKASWCSTCKAQERVIKRLKSANPSYEKAITFIDVDWDDHGKSEIVKNLNIPRRSTLVVLKGNKELGRIVAGTGEAEIKALMDTALAAATS